MNITKKRAQNYINTWVRRCYHDGLPDCVPDEIKDLCPSYKHIAMCILKNDLYLTGLGYSAPESKFYGILKRIELRDRGVIKDSTERTLFDK